MYHFINFLKHPDKHDSQLAVIGILSFLVALSRGALLTYLPPYINNVFLSVGIVGVILAIPKIISLGSDFLIERFSSKIHKKSMVLTSLLFFAAQGVLYYAFHSKLILIIGLIIYGVASELYWIPIYSKLMEVTPNNKESSYEAIFKSFNSFGWSIGPLIGGFIIASAAPNNLFIFFSSICIFIFLYAFQAFNEPKAHHIKSKTSAIKDYTNLHPRVKLGLFLRGYVGIMDGIFWMILPLSMSLINTSPQLAGIAVTFATIPYLLFRVPAGIFEDRHSREKVLIPMLLIAAISLFLISTTKNFYLIIALVFLASTCGAILSPAYGGLIIHNSTKKQRDIASAYSSIFENGGILIARIGGALVIMVLGFYATFTILGVIAVGVSIYTGYIIRKH